MPEIALTFYKRLFELGINSPEIWNNLGLCAFQSNQYDFCLSCFERGLQVAKDEEASEIWYNISHVATYIGDLSLAYQALKISLAFNGENIEALNNIGVLEKKKDKLELAKNNFLKACNNNNYVFEPYYNYASLRYQQGVIEDALKYAKKSIEINPEHFESREIVEMIEKEMMK